MNRRVGTTGREFDEWYLRARAPLERALWVMCGDRNQAQDLCDEAFTRALAHWDRVCEMQSPGGWVYTVALNLLRRRRRRSQYELGFLKRQRTEPSPPVEVHPGLWAAVADLPDRQREAIALRYVSDLTEAEVATAMGVTDGLASATLSKARRRLAEVLRDEPVEEDVT